MASPASDDPAYSWMRSPSGDPVVPSASQVGCLPYLYHYQVDVRQ